MYFGTTIYKYGPSRLPLSYSDEELGEIIDSFIAGSREFSFSQLNNHILASATQQNKFLKENNTSYSQVLLTLSDTSRICKMLWERIWNKELIQLFYNPRDSFFSTGEVYFVKNR